MAALPLIATAGTHHFDVPLPWAAPSVTAVDYKRDLNRLDLILSTDLDSEAKASA